MGSLQLFSAADFLTDGTWRGVLPGGPLPLGPPQGSPKREGFLSVTISFNLKTEETMLKISAYFKV